jgi:uncharacterized protein
MQQPPHDQPAMPAAGSAVLAGPTPPGRRIVALDALRGMAVLGILMVNIQAMGRPLFALGPALGPSLEGGDYLAWFVTHLFFEQKFFTLFSMMFGAGLVLLGERREAAGQSPAILHLKRSGWLLVIGLAHAYLIWAGDILVPYALCGLVVFWCRRWPNWALIGSGLLLFAIPAGVLAFVGWSVAFWPEEAVTSFQQQIGAASEPMNVLVEQYRGGWIEQMGARAGEALEMQTLVFLFWSFWLTSGLMMLGMALYKLGFLTGNASARTYRLTLILAVLVGLPVVIAGVLYQQAQPDAPQAFFYSALFNHGASLLVALGWAATLMLIIQHQIMTHLTELFTAAGRMALTNYLFQSIVGTFVFYGHGLGLYARLGWWEPIGIVLLVWIFQLWASRWWLRRYRFGPAEWLWRSLTYGQRQPMRQPAMP